MALRWIFNALLVFLNGITSIGAEAQTERVVLIDSLNNGTIGKQTGGEFIAGGGWQSTGADNMIVYDLGEYIENGSVEIDIRNFDPQSQSTKPRHHFLAMFRNPWGTHHPAEDLETVWDLHAGTRYEPGIKVLSWTYQEDESISELQIPTWDVEQAFHLKITWQGNNLQYYRNDELHTEHRHSAPMQLRYLFVGRDFTVSGDLETEYKNNQYPAVIGPIYSNLIVRRFIDSTEISPPVVSDFSVEEVYANAARIRWTTDEGATCFVEYGASTSYGQSTVVLGPPATTHETVLSSLQPNQTYNYRIVSRDLHGNITTSENQAFTTLTRGRYLFTPIADTFVEADGVYAPTRRYGNFGWMHLLLSSGREVYLRFEVKDISGKVTNAVLRFHGRQSGSGGEIRVLESDWEEMEVTWRNKPTQQGPTIGFFPPVKADEWTQAPVTAAVQGNGVFNFVLNGSDQDASSIDSRESTNFAPELILTTAEDQTHDQSLLRFSQFENDVLRPGPAGSWDENIRERGWFMYDNGMYHAWYGGWRGEYDHNVPRLVKLGYATSTDGVNWTKHPNNPIYDETWIEDMCVVKNDSMYFMYAEDEYTGDGNHVHVVLYKSSDGINWIKHGPVLERDGNGWESYEVATPTVWKEDDGWYMLYEGIGDETAGQIGLATSADGINWTRSEHNPVLANHFGTDRDIAIDSIVKIDGVYYAYGHFRNRSNDWVEGVFTSCDLISWTLRSSNIPSSSAVIVDNGKEFFLYGVDFNGRAPFRMARAYQRTAADESVNCLPKENYALKFDGIDDQIVIEDNDLLSGGIGKSITVEAWIKPSEISGTRPIIQKFFDNMWKDWGLQIKEGKLEVAIENAGDNWSFVAGDLVPEEWSHVAFTFDNSTDLVHLLVNGAEVGNKLLRKNMPNTKAPIRLGNHSYSNNGFAGEMDEVRIWNVPRGVEDIATLLSTQMTGDEQGLITYWQMNEGGGQLVNDGIGNRNPGSLGVDSTADTADPVWIISTAPIGAIFGFGQIEKNQSENPGFNRAPGSYALYQNFPNPFNPATTIGFDLPEAGSVRLSVYDLLGREVVTLLNGDRAAGHHTVNWNARDARGQPVSSGIYFYRLEAGSNKLSQKMLLSK